jgi:copper(I)-binding protein
MRLLPLLLLIPSLARAELVLEDAWIQNLPASVPVRAGYLTITNPATAAARIVGLRGAAFTRIEIHRSTMKDGTMQMEAVLAIEIEAGQTLRLEPGGLHLMMYPRQPTRPGDSYRVIVEFGDGETRNLDMVVRK